MTYVIGIDPGPSSGLVALRDGVLHTYYQGSPKNMILMLSATLCRAQRENESVVIACERYVSSGRPGRTHQVVPQQVIGQVELLATQYECELVMQSPGDAKRIAPNPMLRRLGLYRTPSDVVSHDANDVNDAARHAVLLLASRFVTVLERLLNAQPRDDDDVT